MREKVRNSDGHVFHCFAVCSQSLNRNLSGMAIADITLLSGFEAVTEDLDRVSSSLYLLFVIVILSTKWKGLFWAPQVRETGTESNAEVLGMRE